MACQRGQHSHSGDCVTESRPAFANPRLPWETGKCRKSPLDRDGRFCHYLSRMSEAEKQFCPSQATSMNRHGKRRSFLTESTGCKKSVWYEIYQRVVVVASAAVLSSTLALLAVGNQSSAATNILGAERDEQIEYRLKWNLDTLVGDYERHGRHDPKWDESAKAGLTSFAQSRAIVGSVKGKVSSAGFPAAIKTAVSNGCDDPLILYLHARSVLSPESHTEKEPGEAYRLAAEALSQSQYAPIRKFYAALRAAEALNAGSTNTTLEVRRWRDKAIQYLVDAVKDKTMPPAEVYESCDQMLKAVKNNKQEFGQFYLAFDPIIFKNWPSDASLYLLKGTFYKDYAWQARGSAYAYKVTDEGWDLFAERLAEAEKALTKAWELNPRDERIALQMLRVELGQGKGRARMEMWFQRAAVLNPNYYDAFHAKLYYLEPKWHGSPEDMLEFGRECVKSKQWGGHVPLILRDAHESLAKYLKKEQQAAYWKQPEVWEDLKAAFEKFFALNPGEKGWRHNYALYAYRAEQWDDLNLQLPLLGKINYEFFGGKNQYENMVRLAKEHTRK